MANVLVEAIAEFFDLEGQHRRDVGEQWETDELRAEMLEQRHLVKPALAAAENKMVVPGYARQ